MVFNKPANSVEEFQKLIESHHKEILQLTYKQHLNDDDLKQKILYNVWRDSSKYDCKHYMSTYIISQAVFTRLAHLRSFFRRKNSVILMEPATLPDVEEENIEDFEYLHNIIESQPTDLKKIIKLKFWEDKTLKEISKEVSIPVSTIYVKLQDFLINTRIKLNNE